MQSEKYRYEIKFVSNNNNINYFYNWINNQTLFKRSYPKRIINSFYFDDDNYSSANDNIIGVPNRKKYRLRWYNNDISKLNFEVKIRKNHLNKKKIFKLSENIIRLIDDKNLLFKKINRLLIYENIILRNYITPKLRVTYKREYYVNNDGIRLTIDDELYFNDSKLIFKPYNYFNNYKIIELKFEATKKDLVNRLIKKLNFSPVRQSKYVLGLSKLGYINYI